MIEDLYRRLYDASWRTRPLLTLSQIKIVDHVLVNRVLSLSIEVDGYLLPYRRKQCPMLFLLRRYSLRKMWEWRQRRVPGQQARKRLMFKFPQLNNYSKFSKSIAHTKPWNIFSIYTVTNVCNLYNILNLETPWSLITWHNTKYFFPCRHCDF